MGEGESSSPTPPISETNANDRTENTTVCLPIVRGSVAWYLGKKADEFQTHQWTLFLRGANDEDLSAVIEKVVFTLHSSFAQPVREFTQPPYEVTEKGWGEFEAQIRIFWKDPNESATMVTHGIKLYPPGSSGATVPSNTETPVVAETYDEVVFTNPNKSFFSTLQALRSIPTIETDYSQHKHFQRFSDTEAVHALLEAQRVLTKQIAAAKGRLQYVDTEMAEADAILLELERRKAASRKKSATVATATKNPKQKVT